MAHQGNRPIISDTNSIGQVSIRTSSTGIGDMPGSPPINSEGTLAHGVLEYGQGRTNRVIYYQYASTADQIKSASAHKLLASELESIEESNGMNLDDIFDEDEDDSKAVSTQAGPPEEAGGAGPTLDDDSGSETDENDWSFSFYKLWRLTGPGWLMSIAYLDPGNLEADLQAGVMTGYSLIWVLFWSTAIGWSIQNLASRLGTVTGRHLAEVARYEYNKPTAVILWILTELAIIGADIQEIVGTAIAMKLLFGIPLYAGCLVCAGDTFLFLLLHRVGMRVLEAFFCALIATMAICFAVEFAIGGPDFKAIALGTVIPQCKKDESGIAIGIFGALIMPHNLYLHSALCQVRPIPRHKKRAVVESNFYFQVESAISLFVSFIINVMIISVFAIGFSSNGANNEHASTNAAFADIGLSDAGDYLNRRFGKLAKLVWAIGLISSGQSSTMTGTLAGQYVMYGYVNLNWEPWKRTTMTRSIALIPSLIVAIVAQAYMDTLNEWINVQQSVLLPFALLPLLFFCCNERIMGSFALGMGETVYYWLICFLIIVVNLYLIVAWTIGADKTFWYTHLIFWTIIPLYIALVVYLCYDFFNERLESLTRRLERVLKDGKRGEGNAEEIGKVWLFILPYLASVGIGIKANESLIRLKGATGARDCGGGDDSFYTERQGLIANEVSVSRSESHTQGSLRNGPVNDVDETGASNSFDTYQDFS